MTTEEFIEKCSEKLHCQYCGEQITGGFSMTYGSGITSEDALAKHERDCPSNPESPEGKLLRDIRRCQTEARIFNCLNCQHYQKKCQGSKN